MKRIAFIIAIFVSFQVHSQTYLDIELKGGMTFNGKGYDMSDGRYSFNLQNGYNYGIGFDLWFKNNFGLSWGYSHGQSIGRGKIDWVNQGSSSRYLGSLKDRLFYAGVKYKIQLTKSTALIPFAGIFWNSTFFDADDVEYNSMYDFMDVNYYESVHNYARFNSYRSDFYGSIGAKIGLGIEQKLGDYGFLTMNFSYQFDFLRNIDQSTYAYFSEMQANNTNGSVINSSYHYSYTDQRKGRNMFMIELGYKMPCSLVFGKKKKDRLRE